MPMMICPRKYLLRTTSGHLIRFEPDVPKFVPDVVYNEALAVNILPVEGAIESQDSAADMRPIRVEIVGLLRDAMILKAIEDLVTRNDQKDFDGGGRPKIPSINDLTGLALNAKERETFWEKFKELRANGEALPTHKHQATVQDIQYIRSPKEVAEYAEILGIDEKLYKGRPLKDQKLVLIGAAMKQA